MPSLRLKIPSLAALSILIGHMAITAFGQKTIKPEGVTPEFGFAVAKLLQQFHLPGSPDQLLGFLAEYALRQKLGNTPPSNWTLPPHFHQLKAELCQAVHSRPRH